MHPESRGTGHHVVDEDRGRGTYYTAEPKDAPCPGARAVPWVMYVP